MKNTLLSGTIGYAHLLRMSLLQRRNKQTDSHVHPYLVQLQLLVFCLQQNSQSVFFFLSTLWVLTGLL